MGKTPKIAMPILNFLHNTQFDDIPTEVIEFAKRCLLDLIGVAAAGSQTHLTRIISEHAKLQFGTSGFGAHIWFGGDRVSPAGAALANGMMIDSIDAHDGYRPAKGHVGCHVLPALIAYHQAYLNGDGKRLLADFVVGYEIGCRAGEALHASVPDYHTSGAWGAVTAAALGARTLGLDAGATRHAIGIGEYHGPRSQMMRVIDHPTMLKDGSGWGAMAGVSAAYLAASGFTGAPAISVEGDDVAEYWSDLGNRWLILEQYFKPYPVCRWAQPATAAALAVSTEHRVSYRDIEHIEVFSFHEACRLATRTPADTEQAQYSLPFPVAAALVFGKIGPAEIDGASLTDKRVLRLSEFMKLSEHEPYNDAFPQERYAHVHVTLKDGRVLKSERHQANGDPDTPLTDEEIIEKFHTLADPVIGEERANIMRGIVKHMEEGDTGQGLISQLALPISPVN
ncbi:MAG: MmgE/PrpD family protein [Rhizobiaceae bacterium]|nr:MmgE/PrpD family protein [Rhizobiaceae bacterium]